MLVILLATGSVAGIAAYKATQKQKVVAGAIFKFIKFVDWKRDTTENFNMCLQQYDAAFEPFTQRKIRGKTIKLVLLTAEIRPDYCDALYLNDTETDKQQVINQYKNTLTISEQSGFLSQGGIIELGSQNNRLTFSINQQAAKANQLTIGFQLLSLAQHVIEN